MITPYAIRLATGIAALALPLLSEIVAVQVRVVERQDSSTRYDFVVPGFTNSRSDATGNCYGNPAGVNCSASSTTTTTSLPTRRGSYSVQGATLALELPDGRVAVVNCESKYAPKGDYVNKRSCRIPVIDEFQAEFNGDKAKLKWPVSLDGKKLQSETYKVIAVLPKPRTN